MLCSAKLDLHELTTRTSQRQNKWKWRIGFIQMLWSGLKFSCVKQGWIQSLLTKSQTAKIKKNLNMYILLLTDSTVVCFHLLTELNLKQYFSSWFLLGSIGNLMERPNVSVIPLVNSCMHKDLQAPHAWEGFWWSHRCGSLTWQQEKLWTGSDGTPSGLQLQVLSRITARFSYGLLSCPVPCFVLCF